MKPSEILMAAWGIVSAAPTYGYYARDSKGREANPESDEACTWCSLGAVRKVIVTNHPSDFYDGYKERGFLAQAAADVLQEHGINPYESGPAVPKLNDKHPELRDEMFKRAIALARQEEGSECSVSS